MQNMQNTLYRSLLSMESLLWVQRDHFARSRKVGHVGRTQEKRVANSTPFFIFFFLINTIWQHDLAKNTV